MTETAAEKNPLLEVVGLCIDRPDGRALLVDAALTLRPGEIVALLGGSGAGKSTFVRALHEPEDLRQAGFRVAASRIAVEAQIGIVPQRGALFDHLDVAGNLALALRNADPPGVVDATGLREHLASIDLPVEWAAKGQSVGKLSGGEAQRLSVARTLAGGRRILIMDEPSVGLDPLREDALADLLRAEIRRRDATALVITHELEFAAGIADRFLHLDRKQKVLVELEVETPEPSMARDRETRRRIAARVGDLLVERLAAEETEPEPPARGLVRFRVAQVFDGFAIVPRIGARVFGALRRLSDFREVFRVVLAQAFLRPSPFFAVVSSLIGFTLLYILHRTLGGGDLPLRADKVFGIIGSMHIIALSPALAGILFSATAGNAVTAWLGGMALTRQTVALRGLGIAPERYLYVPAWIGLVLAHLALAVVFTIGMVAGGVAYLALFAPELAEPFAVVTADLLDPPPDRTIFRTRAVVLVTLYALGSAADAIAKGAREMNRAEDVTIAMVGSVMTVTVWIVLLELLTLLYIYGVLR